MRQFFFSVLFFVFVGGCEVGGRQSDSQQDPGPGGDETCVSCPVQEPCIECGDLFVDFGQTGKQGFSLHASPGMEGETRLIAIAIPFPQNTLSSASELVITDSEGIEVATHVEALGYWPTLDGSTRGVRSALVWMEATLGEQPVPLELVYGASRSLELGPQGDPRDTWHDVTESDYSMAIAEPAAYAVFEPGWLSASLVAMRAEGIGQTPVSGFDEFFVGASRTAVNDVPEPVDARIDYETGNEPWLFDRAATLFGTYVRTGDIEWLRHAHRAAEFYRLQVGEDGYFSLRPGDLKYSYGQSLAADLFLTGNREVLVAIERVAGAGLDWNESYTVAANFWTERHQAYALFAAVSAWEATGEPAHRDRSADIVATTLSHIETPPEGMPMNGCLTHGFEAHEGVASDDAVCSPWMSALLVDAVWRYYLVSRDDDALRVISHLTDFVTTYGIYQADTLVDDMTMPYYLASSEIQYTDSGPWADMEHNCDVGGMLARGAWAKNALGLDSNAAADSATSMLEGCALVLDYWHRPAGPENGLAEWRLSPPRKFSWWFKSTLDLAWLSEEVGM